MTSHTDQAVVLAALADLLRRICRDDRIELSVDTLLADIDGLDSLRLLQAVASLEDMFCVEIESGALDDLERVSDLLAAMATAVPASAPGACGAVGPAA